MASTSKNNHIQWMETAKDWDLKRLFELDGVRPRLYNIKHYEVSKLLAMRQKHHESQKKKPSMPPRLIFDYKQFKLVPKEERS